MNAPTMSARSRLRAGLLAALVSLALFSGPQPLRRAFCKDTGCRGRPVQHDHHPAGAKPTMVLVHSALADASGCTGVVHRL
jgi:hypothetical protein